MEHEVLNNRSLMLGTEQAVAELHWQASQENTTSQLHMHRTEEQLQQRTQALGLAMQNSEQANMRLRQEEVICAQMASLNQQTQQSHMELSLEAARHRQTEQQLAEIRSEMELKEEEFQRQMVSLTTNQDQDLGQQRQYAHVSAWFLIMHTNGLQEEDIIEQYLLVLKMTTERDDVLKLEDDWTKNFPDSVYNLSKR